MGIDNLQAVGFMVAVLKDEIPTERNGLILPELGAKQPNTGRIISVGEKVADSTVQVGKTAVFHKGSGNPIQIFDTEVTFLIQNDNQQQVLAVY
jgi:co-chaperonin GroES (HSP10)